MRPKTLAWVVVAGAAMGFLFTAVSTSDFIQHLDRNVHGLHCSFLPGVGPEDAAGRSGCHVTLMSPYSSVLRRAIWGGVPNTLAGMGVFAFIGFWALYLIAARRIYDRSAVGFLFIATCIPMLTSLVLGFISFSVLGTACKVCVGIYIASIVVFVTAWLLWRKASVVEARRDESEQDAQQLTDSPLGMMLSNFQGGVIGAMVVILPIALYFVTTPSYARYVASCGTLPRPADPYQVMVPLSNGNGPTAIEVLDPLCPSCKAFEARLSASGLNDRLVRKALLFPLDKSCNWMIGASLHPGACAVSEAVLCANTRAQDVLSWSFENQEAIIQAATSDPKRAEAMVRARFPDLASCLGSASVKAKLNRALRWAVGNNLPVLTPQLFVNGVKLCDEDTDLGLDYMLHKLVSTAGGHP